MINALIFGTNYEGTENELNGCLNDADYWKSVFGSKAVGTMGSVRTLTGEDMTKANMVESIAEMLDNTPDDGVAYIPYSGHGTIIPPGTQSWVPNDFDWDDKDTWLTYNDLDHIFLAHEKRGVLVVVISDSCHSKADPRIHFRDLESPKKAKNRFLEPPAHIKKKLVAEPFHKNILTVNQDDLLLSGCRKDQTSADAYINNAYAGAFRYSLSTAIDPFLKGAAPVPTYMGAIVKARGWLANNGYNQVPSVDGDPKIAGLPFFRSITGKDLKKSKKSRKKRA